MSDRKKPFMLAILDGLGNNPNPKANAVYHAITPTLDRLRKTTPQTELVTCGPRVGLPDGQMGNSEVGHLNIGAGRVVEQELLRINRAVEHDALASIPALQQAFQLARNSAIHFIGLMSTGGVHSSLEHVKALVKASVAAEVPHVFLHAITDGRDTPPQSAIHELADLENFLATLPGKTAQIATICGRYYAMDRDRRWDRTKKAYDLYTLGTGESFPNTASALQTKKEAGEYDEFLQPIVISTNHSGRRTVVQSGDVVVFCNFRADRMRQIVRSFFEPADIFKDFSRDVVLKLSALCTLTEYEAHFPVSVLFQPFKITRHLGEIAAGEKIRQLRIAETEKYPHVTYFFNGGIETPFEGEERIMVPSPRDVPTYDKKPEMSAFEVTKELLRKINEGATDLIVVNYANCDMVGHTGNFDAAVRAVETVDTCLGQVLEALQRAGGTAIVTADHGNAEQMVDYETGEPHTQHTLYPVPLFVVDGPKTIARLRSGGSLCDIAPTICELLSIPQPKEMTGLSLITK